MSRLLRLAAFVAALIIASTASALSPISATLQHGDQATAFYGATALVDAHAAAEAGDAIYLSEGTFNETTFTKPVKLYGTGTNSKVSLVIQIPTTEAGLYIEGLQFESIRSSSTAYRSEMTFKRCRFPNTCDVYSDGAHFIQCNLFGTTNTLPQKCNQAVFENCKFRFYQLGSYGYGNGNSVSQKSIFKNCVLYNFDSKLLSATFQNCVILAGTPADSYSLEFNNCILPFTPAANNVVNDCTQMTADEITALFKSTSTYELTDEAAATYKGTDGTQLGIFGGSYPYTLTPSTPVVTKVVMPSTPDANGKLPFEITVETRK